ncbi:MAG: hypothetical protein Q8O88_05035 [bacterium]|nr:hypothetical protein [bacterium]
MLFDLTFFFWDTEEVENNLEQPVNQPNLQQPINQYSSSKNKSITRTERKYRYSLLLGILGVIVSMNISFLVYAWTNGFVATSIAAMGDSPLTYFIYLIVTFLISILTFGTVLHFFIAIGKKEIYPNQQAQPVQNETPVMQSKLQQSASQPFSLESRWKLKKRYLYSLLYGIPGFFVSIPLYFISSISLLFICFPMDPHNFCSEHQSISLLFIPVFFLPWWIVFIRMGFVAGKKLEKDQSLNKKHILVSAGITAVFVLIIIIFLIIPIGGISQIRSLSKLF